MRRTKETMEKSYDEVYYRFQEIENTDVLEMKWKKIIDPDIDGYHETMKILSKDLKFEYERTKKEEN